AATEFLPRISCGRRLFDSSPLSRLCGRGEEEQNLPAEGGEVNPLQTAGGWRMAVTTRFNRSLYVTLGLACACLGYAELIFLPEMSVYTAIVGLLLAVAYAMEGRWALTIRAANILGGVIAVGAVGWIASQF